MSYVIRPQKETSAGYFMNCPETEAEVFAVYVVFGGIGLSWCVVRSPTRAQAEEEKSFHEDFDAAIFDKMAEFRARRVAP